MSQSIRRGKRVLLWRPGQPVCDTHIADTTDAMQQAIGGGWPLSHLIAIESGGRIIALVRDEDGERKKLPRNRGVPGRFLVVAYVEGRLVDLTDFEARTFARIETIDLRGCQKLDPNVMAFALKQRAESEAR